MTMTSMSRFVLAAGLLLLLVPSASQAEVFRLDFEDGLLPESHGWSPILIANHVASVVSPPVALPDGGNLSLRMQATDAGGWYIDVSSVAVLDSDWMLEMDVLRASANGPFGGNDLAIQRVGAGTGGAHALPVPESNDGQWHRIRVEMNHDLNEVRHYVDGVHVSTIAPIDDLVAYVPSSNAILFLFGNGSITVDAYFDNIVFALQHPVRFGSVAALNTNAGTDSGEDGLRPVIATDRAEGWMSVWSSTDSLGDTIGSDSDILVSSSSDAGSTWSAPIPLNTDAVSDSVGDALPSLATDGAGTWIATWQRYADAADVVVARSTDFGATWTAPATLAPSPTIVGLSPFVETDGAGDWIIVWSGYDSLDPGTLPDIRVSRSNTGGASWTLPITITTPGIVDVLPSVGTDGSGGWVAIWTHGAGSLGPIHTSRSTDSGATWTPAMLLEDNVAQATNAPPRIASDGAGNWLALWSAWRAFPPSWEIHVSRSSDTGASWTTPAPLNANAGTGSSNLDADIATDGLGSWLVVWESTDDLGGTIGADPDILVAHSNDIGATWSAPSALSNDAATDLGSDRVPTIATDEDGVWVAVWSSTDDLDASVGVDTDIFFARGFGPDADGDGLTDGAEDGYGTDPYDSDSDGDGLDDYEEVEVYGTDPLETDTDGDGYGDAVEVAAGSDPLDAASTPATVPALARYGAVALAVLLLLLGSGATRSKDRSRPKRGDDRG